MQNTACDAGNKDSATGLGKSHGEANGNPVQYSYLENSMDRGAWWAIVHGVAERQIQLTNETTTIYKKMSLGHKKGIHVNQLNWGGWTSSLLYRMKLEREKQILYINAYVWSLGKWYQWNYLQSRNRGGENRSVAGKERAGWTEEAALTCTHCRVWDGWLVGAGCVAQGVQPGALRQPGRVARQGRGSLGREGTCVQLWLIHIVAWQKPAQHCGTVALQLKGPKQPPEKTVH